MMLRRLAGVALVAISGWSGSAGAEPITITSGSLSVGEFGPASSVPSVIDLSGERGFTMKAIGGWGFFGPMLDCDGGCVAGQTVDLSARWGGLDLNGTATLDGVTYEHFGSGNEPVADVIFVASFVLPADAGSTVDVTTPFLFTGQFIYGQTGPQLFTESLVGAGQVTTRFRLSTDPNRTGYTPESTLYAFGPANPVPEPDAWLLVCTGLGMMAAAARQRGRGPGRQRNRG